MCGRFRQSSTAETLKTLFGVTGSPFVPAGVVSPTMKTPVIRGNVIAPMNWGYVPGWADGSAQKLINARGETLAEKPSFRDSFRARRCLVPADGFIEWTVTKPKRAYDIALETGGPFAFASIWDTWQGVEGFAIVTMPANDLISPVHDRMPVILASGEDCKRWLSAPDLSFTAPNLVLTPAELTRKAAGDDRQMQLF